MRTDDKTFIELFQSLGGGGTAKRTETSERAVFARRKRIEQKLGRTLLAPGARASKTAHPQRISLDIENGVMLVGSDPHYWPGSPSPAHRAFVRFCKELKPKIVVMNGDVLDGATVSRHPPLNWEERPSLINEIEASKERLAEIEAVIPRTAKMAWCLGNHDARFEMKLAATVPEYAKIHGFHLKDHFGPRWIPGWAVWVNNSVVVKHRWKGGVHGVYNNVVGAGLTMVTGHDHALRASPYTDYTGTRWGVSTGCLAEPDGPQFDYNEDNPRNHRAGFAVFTFVNGRLLPPELVHVSSAHTVDFRGEVINI